MIVNDGCKEVDDVWGVFHKKTSVVRLYPVRQDDVRGLISVCGVKEEELGLFGYWER